jgi:hypothetical protein
VRLGSERTHLASCGAPEIMVDHYRLSANPRAVAKPNGQQIPTEIAPVHLTVAVVDVKLEEARGRTT